MIVRIVGHNNEAVFPFKSAGPWDEFYKVFVNNGILITQNNFGVHTDALISNCHSSEAMEEAIKNGVPRERRALILWEPRIVDSYRYKTEILSQYGVIYSPSPLWAEKVGGKIFKWPQDIVNQIESHEDWIPRKNKAVMIQGNKWSAQKGEMYSLRRKIISQLPKDLDLYGVGWNRGIQPDLYHLVSSMINSSLNEIKLEPVKHLGKKYKNYFGEVSNKYEVLSKYKVSIVIENSQDFISEKLFDSVSAGCICIYVGPQVSLFELSSTVAISANPSIKDITDKFYEIVNLPSIEQYAIAQNQNRMLRNTSERWNNFNVLRKLALDLINDLQIID